MNSSKSFLAIDFGAGTIKAAEFEIGENGVLRLLRHAVQPLGRAGAQDATRRGAVQRGLQELIGSKVFESRRCNACPPAHQTFSKFIKLPPVDPSKAAQIVQYEAQQNIPFPLDQVVWDYQILGALPSKELEVLLAAIKTDAVESLFKSAEKTGLRLELVDAGVAAMANAFRYNYSDLDGCSMVLDIGARTSKVYFFEGDKFYARTINIGANSITQDFALDSKLPFADAEKIKIAEGFVGLGGAYEEPENPHQAAISKIARQIMTRLHIQVNQTIQFFRTQQGGSPPQRLFLAGAGATMPYTTEFFSEKLNIPIEYFNPFRNIDIDPSVDLDELAKLAHSFGEVVGLGLRNPARCPIELNLMPKSILKQQQLNQKKPYFFFSFLCLVFAILAMGMFFDRVAAVRREAMEQRAPTLQRLQGKERQFKAAIAERDEAKKTLDQYTERISDRFRWIDLITELRNALTRTEAAVRRPGIRPGLWIEKMAWDKMQAEEAVIPGGPKGEEAHGPQMDIVMMRRYGLLPPAAEGGGAEGLEGIDTSTLTPDELQMLGLSPSQGKTEDTNTVSTINLTCRGVSWENVYATADSELAYTFLKELVKSPFFVGPTNGLSATNATHISGNMQKDENSGTFTFDVKLKLAQPIKL
ncbi:MAG: type IV pilus assembly protein PilM [Verrucomicrobia bacterium]|nr:type IV pilus assembly protein PilM [Verrucomicrobiota bacterium]